MGGRDVVASYEVDDLSRSAFNEAGISTPRVVELDPAKGVSRFYNAILDAKNASPFGKAVALYDIEDYAGMRLFLSEDGTAGFAIKPGPFPDIISVFNKAGGPHKGVAHPLIRLAVEQGGRKLDEFDTVLPPLYAANGFEAIARTKWNDEYAPDGWDKSLYSQFNRGEPDVVLMAYTGTNKPYASSDGQVVDDWDKGVEMQEAAVREPPKKQPQQSWR